MLLGFKGKMFLFLTYVFVHPPFFYHLVISINKSTCLLPCGFFDRFGDQEDEMHVLFIYLFSKLG